MRVKVLRRELLPELRYSLSTALYLHFAAGAFHDINGGGEFIPEHGITNTGLSLSLPPVAAGVYPLLTDVRRPVAEQKRKKDGKAMGRWLAFFLNDTSSSHGFF